MTVEVDPALLAIIGKAGAPGRVPRLPIPPATLPGSMNGVVGAYHLVRILQSGLEYLLAYRARVGDFYRGTSAGTPMAVLWDADEIHRIFKNEERVWSTGMAWNAGVFDRLDPRGGNSGMLLTLDFDEHRAARKLVQPAFTMTAIESYLRTAERMFGEAIDRWVAQGHVTLKEEARTLLASVAGEIFTGIRDPKELAVVDRALSDFWSILVVISRNAVLSPTFRRARRGLATLIDTFTKLVPERRKNGGEDLFSRMCLNEDLEGLDDDALVRVFITIMFGAFDTTSAAMTSMGYFLAKHPEWQERLRAEALAAPTGPLDAAALRAMKHHEWAWKETLRLVPVVAYLARAPLRDVDVLGHRIAAGTQVMIMTGGIGRHPKWWTNPDTFDPERFSPERAEDKKHPGIYNPFGAGAHACVGMQVANMEMKQFWHRMLRTCRFRLAPDYEARHSFAPFGVVSGDVRLAIEKL
jgi:cytochrome P450